MKFTEYERDGYVGVTSSVPGYIEVGCGIHLENTGKTRQQAITEARQELKKIYDSR